MPSELAAAHKAGCLADLAVTILKSHVCEAMLQQHNYAVTLQGKKLLCTGIVCMHCNMQDVLQLSTAVTGPVGLCCYTSGKDIIVITSL